jgi:GH24 family phage-related lysozyme (muramidase)
VLEDLFPRERLQAFNIGIKGFLSSTVLREHLASNFQAASQAFLLWDKAHVDDVEAQLVGHQ